MSSHRPSFADMIPFRILTYGCGAQFSDKKAQRSQASRLDECHFSENSPPADPVSQHDHISEGTERRQDSRRELGADPTTKPSGRLTSAETDSLKEPGDTAEHESPGNGSGKAPTEVNNNLSKPSRAK